MLVAPPRSKEEKGGGVCRCKMEIRTSEVGKKKYWMQNECCDADELEMEGGADGGREGVLGWRRLGVEREGVLRWRRSGVSGAAVKMNARVLFDKKLEVISLRITDPRAGK